MANFFGDERFDIHLGAIYDGAASEFGAFDAYPEVAPFGEV
jgi:fructosamine-3-kinase